MESPPSFSTQSEAPPLSEDSGLLITSGSFSSDSASGWQHVASELQESDFDERSLSLCESTETSERMCGDFFNTVKKGPAKVILTTIEPPPEFQDNPGSVIIEKCTTVLVPPSVVCTNDSPNKIKITSLDISMSTSHVSPIYPRKLKPDSLYERRQCLNHRFTSPRLLHLSPCRATRPSSRNSLSSRLSSSHNSLITQFQVDDSSFITQAISHDTLSAKTSDITDMYNVPFDSDIYAVPIDMVRPNRNNIRIKGKRLPRNNKKRGKSTPQNIGANCPSERNTKLKEPARHKDVKTKRHSLPSSSFKKSATDSDTDSLQVTLREMRKYLHTLYSSSSDSECRNTMNKKNNAIITGVGKHTRHCSKETATAVLLKESNELGKTMETNNNHKKSSKNSFGMNSKNKKHKENIPKDILGVDKNEKCVKKSNQCQKTKLNPVRILSINLKQSFCNLFRWRRHSVVESTVEVEKVTGSRDSPPAAVRRALPPLPQTPHTSHRSVNEEDQIMDFATSLQKVKDYGWYWGPISVEAAEKILSNEPDGSFIVRDSSDDHYIFTLTFKLNGLRHVRIEHDQVHTSQHAQFAHHS
ncbi:unnamed protein product [Diatraea saccharalis]|uniref:SH2 domain-containing protein n=1 Tax=Diatraea saccharalis TaxID=40085 RepID=A0A9N9QSQ8_9NEOP|nr:unnamed protein product [Diatraea saccharalis]